MLGFDRGGAYAQVFRHCREQDVHWVTYRRAPLAVPAMLPVLAPALSTPLPPTPLAEPVPRELLPRELEPREPPMLEPMPTVSNSSIITRPRTTVVRAMPRKRWPP